MVLPKGAALGFVSPPPRSPPSQSPPSFGGRHKVGKRRIGDPGRFCPHFSVLAFRRFRDGQTYPLPPSLKPTNRDHTRCPATSRISVILLTPSFQPPILQEVL